MTVVLAAASVPSLEQRVLTRPRRRGDRQPRSQGQAETRVPSARPLLAGQEGPRAPERCLRNLGAYSLGPRQGPGSKCPRFRAPQLPSASPTRYWRVR